MTTIQYRTSDGLGVTIQGHPTSKIPPKEGFDYAEVVTIPAGPGVLKYDAGASSLTRYLAPLTPEQTFDAAVAAGYTVPGVTPPLVLDLGDSARAQFTGLVVLLDKLMSSGQLLATSTQAIADKSGALHALPVSQIDAILVGYGAYFAGLYNTLHAATVAPAAPPAA